MIEDSQYLRIEDLLATGSSPLSSSVTPKLTMVAVTILLAVGLVDVYLWLLDLGTFTNYIKGFMHPFFGFCSMILIFLLYWWKSDTVEALDVMFGILMGHFFWSWC